MQHKYTDKQIFESNKIAARTTGRDWISRFNLRDVRAILDALPDPGHQPVVMNYDLSEDIWDKARNVTGLSGDSSRYADLIPESQLLVETALQLVLDEHSNPAPVADEWEQCEVGDLRNGDRYLVIGDGWQIEDEVVHAGAFHVCYDPSSGEGIGQVALDRSPVMKLYRIPAPVQHPDPALHQFIRVDGKDYEAIPESGRYKLLGPGLATVHVINRENITEWTELELVPKEVADND